METHFEPDNSNMLDESFSGASGRGKNRFHFKNPFRRKGKKNKASETAPGAKAVSPQQLSESNTAPAPEPRAVYASADMPVYAYLKDGMIPPQEIPVMNIKSGNIIGRLVKTMDAKDGSKWVVIRSIEEPSKLFVADSRASF